MPTVAPLLAALMDALSALTQGNRSIQQHFSASAPELTRNLVPYQLEGEEQVCGGVRYRVQLLSRSHHLSLKALQGLPMAIEIKDGQGGGRIVSGIVSRSEQLLSDGSSTLVQVEFRDALSLLRLRKNRRVFRDQSVIDITKQILGEHLQANPVLAAAFRFTTEGLTKNYPKRAFTQQAFESDRHFLERLWRQEGMAWHFLFALEDDAPTHTLVLSDNNDAFKANPAGTVRYHRADATEKTDTIVAWQSWRELSVGATQRDQHDYKSTKVDQSTEPSVLNQGKMGDDLARTLVDYHYDAEHLGNDSGHQGQMSRCRIQAHEFASKGFRGESVVRQFASGTRFTLSQHHDVDTHSAEDREFTLTSLVVYARNNVRLDDRIGRSLFEGWQYHVPRDETDGGHNGSATDAPVYYNRFECVRSFVPVVPSFDPADVPDVRKITAVVVTENGGELDVDELGRVLVRFPFNHDEAQLQSYGATTQLYNSARVRVMQASAHSGYGDTMWPRKDAEVIVDFLDGHPDKPIIIGATYNGQHAPATYAGRGALPANAPLTGLRTKEVAAERYSHLRFSDFTGQIGAQIATDHAATQLNQGWLGTPHDNGQSKPRGEGFELATDASGALRTARALLISAFGRVQASGQQLDRDETLALMQECVTLFKELGSYAAQYQGAPVDGQAQADQLTKLTNWEKGSNTSPSGGADGGAPMIAVTAPDGLLHSTPASVVLHAGQNVDTVASQHVQTASGGRHVVNAGQGISNFAQSGGIKTIAHQGDHLMQSQQGNTVIQSAQDLQMSASGGKVHVAGATEIVLSEPGGAYIKLAGGQVEIGCPGQLSVKAASHSWGAGASGSAELPQFSVGQVGRTPTIVRATDGKPAQGIPYQLTKADGSVVSGKTGADGVVAVLASQKFEAAKLSLSHPDTAASASSAVADASSPNDSDEELMQRFVILGDNGEPSTGFTYRIDSDGDKLHEGSFDANGATQTFPMDKDIAATFWLPLGGQA